MVFSADRSRRQKYGQKYRQKREQKRRQKCRRVFSFAKFYFCGIGEFKRAQAAAVARGNGRASATYSRKFVKRDICAALKASCGTSGGGNASNCDHRLQRFFLQAPCFCMAEYCGFEARHFIEFFALIRLKSQCAKKPFQEFQAFANFKPFCPAHPFAWRGGGGALQSRAMREGFF